MRPLHSFFPVQHAAVRRCRYTRYDPIGYNPKNAGNVVIKVSLQDRMVYVMEGSKPLLVTATALAPSSRLERPFSSDQQNPQQAVRATASGSRECRRRGNRLKGSRAGYRYVGYPMQYWVNSCTGVWFHVGSVWPSRARMVAFAPASKRRARIFRSARIGTPVYIAQTQPEDATRGQNPLRPHDYNHPDPPKSLLISPQAFKDDPSQYLREQP
jgi:hypothetical protein